MTVICGFDLALATTGWAMVDGDGQLVGWGSFSTESRDPIGARLADIASRCVAISAAASDVYVEGFVRGPSGVTSMRMGMVHGVVFEHLWSEQGREPGVIAPAKVKKHATGKGNAGKDAVMAAARQRWGIDLDPDEADAAWIADYGRSEILTLGVVGI